MWSSGSATRPGKTTSLTLLAGEEGVGAARRLAGAGRPSWRTGVEAGELERGIRFEEPQGFEIEDDRVLLLGVAGEVIATGGNGSVTRSRPE